MNRSNIPDQARIARRNFSFVWLIPILAGLIAAWLGWRTLEQRGPLITITFNSGDGLVAGQTPVRYKAVQLGTAESVRLSPDMTHVIVRVRMRAEAKERLTDKARFWVVRPRISSGNISGLETLVSGAYIAMDPGDSGGQSRLDFDGLENPPGRRSDEPGTNYTLMADNIGALGPGSPVFYRDITVGEVLGYDQPGLHGKIVVHVFVRAPYDKYVRDDSRFWNTSGVEVAIGAGGIRVQMESIQAVLSGGIAFATPPESRAEPPARPETQFELFKDATSASVATSKDRIELLSYFQGSVRGLGIGSTVEIDGIRVGSVTDMRLEYDAAGHDFRVRVRMAIEPDLLTFAQAPPSAGGVRQVLNDFVQRGMQAELQTSSYLTGTMVVALAVPQDARPGVIRLEDGAILMPGMVGGIGNIATSLSDITAKLDKIPFDHIGQSLNDTLGHVNQLVRKTDTGLSPVLQQLPTLEADLHQTLRRVSDMLGEKGYGEDSAFKHDMSRLMDQANDTLRSIRAVADFLERHPEALIRGRGGEGNSR